MNTRFAEAAMPSGDLDETFEKVAMPANVSPEVKQPEPETAVSVADRPNKKRILVHARSEGMVHYSSVRPPYTVC